jgi:hypothetical protein
VVAELLEQGASASAPRNDGLSPLHLAAMRGAVAIMDELLNWGANPDAKDRSGFTVLQKAALLAPSASLSDSHMVLLLGGLRESAAERTAWAHREAANRDEAAFMARYHCHGHPPPSVGVAACGM